MEVIASLVRIDRRMYSSLCLRDTSERRISEQACVTAKRATAHLVEAAPGVIVVINAKTGVCGVPMRMPCSFSV